MSDELRRALWEVEMAFWLTVVTVSLLYIWHIVGGWRDEARRRKKIREILRREP